MRRTHRTDPGVESSSGAVATMVTAAFPLSAVPGCRVTVTWFSPAFSPVSVR